jgi:hypothetical protein
MDVETARKQTGTHTWVGDREGEVETWPAT